jgi:putative aldouronate transport system substrate-binding protein
MEVPYEVLLKYCPTYVQYVTEYGKEAWLYSQYNGRNFGLPTFFSDVSGPRIGAFREDWLRNVGIEKTPSTLDEFYTALKKFRYEDPDGNGKKDTYGWCPDISHWSLIFSEVFAANNNLPFDLMAKDGSVSWGGILPEAKDALAFMKKCLDEDLLDPDFMLGGQGNMASQKLLNGKVGYIYPMDHYSSYDDSQKGSVASNLKKFDKGSVLVPCPPLKNRDGKRLGRSWGGAGHILQFGKHLENEPEKVIRILKMIEKITIDEDLYIASQTGKEGLHWEQNQESNKLELLEPYKSEKRIREHELLREGAMNSRFFYPSKLYQQYKDKYVDKASVSFLDANQRPEWSMINALGKTDVIPSAGRYVADLRAYQLQTYIEFIVGSRSLDTFDEFVQEWKDRGGDVVLKEANEVYSNAQSIYQQVSLK